MPADASDPEIRAFVLATKGLTLSELEAESTKRFGAERAWPADLIADVLIQTRGRRGAFLFDPAIRAFIADLDGTVSIDEIGKLGRERFGERGFPSRSQLYRILTDMRVERRRRAASEPSATSPPGGR